MPKCIKIRTKKQEVCLGDLKFRIELNNRDIMPPIFGSPDFDESFTPTKLIWAAIETVTGKTYFDGVNEDTPVTHIFYIQFDATVTAETWIIFKNRRIDILRVEDLDENEQFLKLTCTDRGLVPNEATKA